MNNETSHITRKEELAQSQVFGSEYLKKLDEDTVPSVSNYSDVQEIFNAIFVEYRLSKFQRTALFQIFKGFEEIRYNLDPIKLKSFDFNLNNDGELLLFRKSSFGITTIVIHEEEDIALSFIPYQPTMETVLEFTQDPAQLTIWAYSFFAR